MQNDVLVWSAMLLCGWMLAGLALAGWHRDGRWTPAHQARAGVTGVICLGVVVLLQRWLQGCPQTPPMAPAPWFLYLNGPFAFPAFSPPTLPSLLHNTHQISFFPTAASSATSIPNLPILIPLPRWSGPFVASALQFPQYQARCYSPKVSQHLPSFQSRLAFCSVPHSRQWNQPSRTVLVRSPVTFSHSYQSCSAISHIMSRNFPCSVPLSNLGPELSQWPSYLL